VVTGTCSIPKDGSACWNKFKEQLGLRLAPVPKCSDEPGKYAGTSPIRHRLPGRSFFIPETFDQGCRQSGQMLPAQLTR
jgi:hypothetical protein